MSERGVWRHEEGKSWLALLDEDRERYLKEPREWLGCLAWVVALAAFVGGLTGVAIGAAGLGLLLPRLRHRAADVTPMLTLPLPAPTFVCDVEVTDVGAHVLGRDRGVASFVDGWLHFEGGRTTFSLSRADVRKRQQNRLEIEGGGVVFLPDGSAKVPLYGRGSSFGTELDRWYRIERAAVGISLLPPGEVHRSGRVRAGADLAAQAALLAGWSASAVSLAAQGSGLAWLGVGFCAFRAFHSLGAAREAGRFLLKRRAFPNVRPLASGRKVSGGSLRFRPSSDVEKPKTR